MNAIMFVIPCTPESNNLDCSDIHRAIAYLCTTNTNLESAEQEAYAYIKSFGWLPQEPEYVFLIQPEHLSRLDKCASRLYHQSCHAGIAMDLVAFPKHSLPDSSPVELRKLNRYPT